MASSTTGMHERSIVKLGNLYAPSVPPKAIIPRVAAGVQLVRNGDTVTRAQHVAP